MKAKLYEIADQIIDHVQASKTHNDQWKRGYEPAPLTYLNQQRWVDEQQIDSLGVQEWWQEAGFEKEWQAINEGCNEFNTRFYRNGVRIDGQVSHS